MSSLSLENVINKMTHQSVRNTRFNVKFVTSIANSKYELDLIQSHCVQTITVKAELVTSIVIAKKAGIARLSWKTLFKTFE